MEEGPEVDPLHDSVNPLCGNAAEASWGSPHDSQPKISHHLYSLCLKVCCHVVKQYDSVVSKVWSFSL